MIPVATLNLTLASLCLQASSLSTFWEGVTALSSFSYGRDFAQIEIS